LPAKTGSFGPNREARKTMPPGDISVVSVVGKFPKSVTIVVVQAILSSLFLCSTSILDLGLRG
jgi:hypothetical protein